MKGRRAPGRFLLRRGDRIVATGVLLILGVSLAASLAVRPLLPRPGGGGTVGEILRDGRVIERIPLEPGVRVERTVRSPGGTNRILVEGGTIRFVSADCPDGDCVRTGPLSRPGQIALCLPHRVEIRVVGGPEPGRGEKGGAPDAVAF